MGHTDRTMAMKLYQEYGGMKLAEIKSLVLFAEISAARIMGNSSSIHFELGIHWHLQRSDQVIGGRGECDNL